MIAINMAIILAGSMLLLTTLNPVFKLVFGVSKALA